MTTMAMTIPAATLRAARPDDLPAVHSLLTASSLPVDGAAESLPTFVVAESEGALVGVAGLELCCDDALLRSVAVHPEWRSRGVGRALVERLISDAEARSLRALYLLTTTAERYFPSFGFREIARAEVPASVRETAEFMSACPASAVVMTRPCGGGGGGAVIPGSDAPRDPLRADGTRAPGGALPEGEADSSLRSD